MPEGASVTPEQDKQHRSSDERGAASGAPARGGSPGAVGARNVAQSDAVLRTHAARQGSSDTPPQGRIVGLSDLAPAPAPAEDAGIEQLVAQIRELIASGQASIKFPGPGHRLDGKPAEAAAPNPAFTNPSVHDKLVALLHKLTNEHRDPTEPWPLADFASKDIPELVELANTLLEARNAKLAPPPEPAAAPSFPGEGHALGGSLTLEESRARLGGSQQPASRKPPSAPVPKAKLPLLPKPQAPRPVPQASMGGASVVSGGGEHGMRDRPSGSSTVTMVVEPPRGPQPTPLLPGAQAQPKVSDGKSEVPEEGADKLPKAPPVAPSAAAQQAAREAYRRHIAQGGGWASEAELAELANAAGVTVVIHHFDESGRETHSVTMGGGAQVVHLRHMGNHYDVIENGRVVKIAGDGHCGFVAFYRAVTGMLPSPEEVAEMRRHAASQLPDEHVDNILAAQDAHDVDMHRMDGSRDSLGLDAAQAQRLLAILESLLGEEDEDEEPSVVHFHEDPGPALDEDAEALVVKQGIEDGASEDLRQHDAEIEAEVEKSLASGSPKLDNEEDEEEDEPSEVHFHSDPPGPPGPPDGGPGRGGPGGRGPSSSPQAQPPQVDYKPTSSGLTDAVLASVDKGSALSGYVGTDGGNNFGAVDAPFKSVVDPMESAKAHTTTSGVSDAISAMGGTVGIGIQISKLKETIAVLKDKEKNGLEKGKAVTDIAGIVTGLTQQYCVLEGGLFTAIDGPEPAQSSNFGFTASGGNMMSTDFKMAGDAAGLLGDLIGLVGTALEAINEHEKLLEGTAAEAVGRVSMTVAKSIGTLGRTAKTLGQFVGQIQGHGQMAKDFGGAAFHTFGKQVVPLVGAGIAAMNIGRQSYNIHKYRKRRERLKALIQSQHLSGKRADAVKFIREVLSKRITRAGIDIGLSSVDLVSSVLQAATPIGSATGTAIAATTTSVRLGMVATRVIKQKLRDRTAEKRKKAKNPSESYESWAARQQAKGVKGKLNATFTMNWDKSSEKKREAYIRHAMTIVEMDSDAVYDTIGLSKAKLAKMKDDKERVEAIIKALQKR